MTPPLTVAPHFHVPGTWAERLLVADGAAWRAPNADEVTRLVREEAHDGAALFSLPAHLRAAFWAMLQRQAAQGDGDFVGFAGEVLAFLAFKAMPVPPGAAVELVAHGAAGAFDAAGLWAVVNLSDDPAWLAWPGVRLRLGPGEGCRVPAGGEPDVLPPVGDDPALWLVVRG